MLHHAIRNQVAWVYNILLASLQGNLMDLPFAAQREQTAPGDMGVTPMGETLYPSAQFNSLPSSSLTMLVFTRGDRLNVCPVHAKSAFLCATIQSNLPSRCTMTMEVIADFVEIKAA